MVAGLTFSAGVIDGARLEDGGVDDWGGGGKVEVGVNGSGAGGLAEEGDAAGVAAESVDVVASL